ncbi:unnamed protein product [Dicrocoelium dendriticum]|nr:unnamed protein product [Dicrocoelium dendriticum]
MKLLHRPRFAAPKFRCNTELYSTSFVPTIRWWLFHTRFSRLSNAPATFDTRMRSSLINCKPGDITQIVDAVSNTSSTTWIWGRLTNSILSKRWKRETILLMLRGSANMSTVEARALSMLCNSSALCANNAQS